MNNKIKSNDAYKTIGEVCKELNLINKKTGALQTHTIRYWESEFKQIKPFIGVGKRRYYSPKDLKVIKIIQSLLKEKGLTIKGVKKSLDNPEATSIDENENIGIYKQNLEYSKFIKQKVLKISKLLLELKKIK